MYLYDSFLKNNIQVLGFAKIVAKILENWKNAQKSKKYYDFQNGIIDFGSLCLLMMPPD